MISNSRKFSEDDFSKMAKKWKILDENGDFESSDEIKSILENNNRCICGAKLYFDRHYYSKYRMWKCPICDG